MDPNHFLMIMLSRFELYHIFSSADCRKRYGRENANKVCLPRNLFFSYYFSFYLISLYLHSLLLPVMCVSLSVSQDVVQQNNTLIEEMLHLVIMIVGEWSFLNTSFELWVYYMGVLSLLDTKESKKRKDLLMLCLFCPVGERYTAGVGQVESSDEIRREIVHQLCIRPMAHSELVKALPENVRQPSRLHFYLRSWKCWLSSYNC